MDKTKTKNDDNDEGNEIIFDLQTKIMPIEN